MIGVTYSAFNYTKKGEKVNVVRTGQLTMTYTESSTNIINIDNAIPTSDEVGKKLVNSTNPEDYFSFEVGASRVNLGDKEVIYYEITAEKLTEGEYASTMSDNDVRIYLEQSTTSTNATDYKEVLPPTSYTPLETRDTLGAEAGEMILYFDSFTSSDKDSKYYKMAMWPSEEYKLDDESRTFAVRVNVYASDTAVNKTSAITLNKNSTTLVKGTTETLTATINSGAKNRKLIWASSDTSVATVTENGVVTAVAPGNANITVRALDEADGTDTTATCQVTVTGAPANGITITETTLVLTLGSEGQTLHATVTPSDYANSGSITWTSSDSSVATVDASGVVTPLKEGSTNITASILGYTSNTCVVTVSKPTPNTITVSPKTASIEKGKTTSLNASITPNNANKIVSWSSSDTSIATVDGNGLVTGVSVGTATITATSTEDNKLTDTATIIVTKTSASSVGLNTSVSPLVGQKTTFIATLYDENNNEITSEDSLDVENNTITWSSGDTSITGDLSSCLGRTSCEIEALSEGSTNVTVTVASNAAASRNLTSTGKNLNKEIEEFLTISVNETGGITRKSADGTIIETSNTLASGATHSNYRYTSNGSNAVNNYVNFNCDLDGTNCELWRIVGSFDGIYSKADSETGKPSGTAERRVKLMRASSIGTYSWDTSDSNTNDGYGVNKWEEGDLVKLLNPNHNRNTGLNASGTTIIVNNSLYWNRASSGNCYTGQGNAVTEGCNFSTIGLKDTGISTTKNMIGNTYWNLGGHNTYTGTALGENNFLQNTVYAAERGDTPGGSSGALYWVGKVALIYPSDYGYAGWYCNKNYPFFEYPNFVDVRKCNLSNWMFVGDHREWLLSPSTTGPRTAWYVDNVGLLDPDRAVSSLHDIRPSVYLKSNVIVKKQDDCNISGTTYARGSEQCPYNIQLGS